MAGSGIVLYTLALTSLFATTLAGTAYQSGCFGLDPHLVQVNATHNATKETVAAPYYRNVTAGDAWVMPSSAYDLGARGMTCECFDPDSK